MSLRHILDMELRRVSQAQSQSQPCSISVLLNISLAQSQPSTLKPECIGTGNTTWHMDQPYRKDYWLSHRSNF